MSAPRRPPRRLVDGVLLLDKPLGMSSNGALQAVRRLYNAAKAGHTGTLDPLATGLLPLCLGEATKFAGELLDADKCYLATLRFGIETDSGDADGQVREARPVSFDEATLAKVLERFKGRLSQVPPMHSALKRDGRPLYEYARQGIEVERKAREVTIHRLFLRSFSDETAEIEVDCSKGTYIRVLAQDIGRALGCGAHLSALRRTRIADLQVGDALTLDQIDALSLSERDLRLAPADALLHALSRVDLDERETTAILRGQAVPMQGVLGQRGRLYGPGGRFLGLAEWSDGCLHPKRLVAHASEQKRVAKS